MPPDAYSSRAKFKRAAALMKELGIELRKYLEEEPFGVYTTLNESEARLEWRSREPTPLGPEIALVAGDVIHNLRSSLDHLMGELVVANGEAPDRATQFPIGSDEAAYRKARDRQAKGASSDVLAMLDELKPWRGGNDSLYLVHHFDIADKHRLLLTTVGAQTQVVLDMAKQFGEDFRDKLGVIPLPIGLVAAEPAVLSEGALLFSAPADGAEGLDPTFIAEIFLGGGDVTDPRPLRTVLDELGQEVEKLLVRFEPTLGIAPRTA